MIMMTEIVGRELRNGQKGSFALGNALLSKPSRRVQDNEADIITNSMRALRTLARWLSLGLN